MAKGSGLSFDPDPITPTVIINKTHFDHFYNPNFKLERSLGSNQEQYFSLSRRSRRAVFTEMESHHRRSSSSSPPTTIQFPVNLNCSSHHHLHPQEDGDDDTRLGGIPMIIPNHEMDFFADKKLDGKSSGEATNISDAADADEAKDGPSELRFNVNTGLHLLTANTSSDQSIVDDGISPNSDDKRAKSELAVVQAELERLNGENQRLREVLNQVTSNYNSLQVHMMTIMQQQQQQTPPLDHPKTTGEKMDVDNKRQNGLVVPRQFMDLGLAGSSGGGGGAEAEEASLSSSEGRDHSRSPQNNVEGAGGHDGGDDSPEKGNWGPNKLARLNNNNNNNNINSNNNNNNNNGSKNVDQATEATMRKARVSVRARSEAPMITDGCQWRKYGQKMAKGNPCPRAYYRCTMAAGCPVRKQVQRCAEDRTILITTYEGNHNHPLPPAAMAMASTTSSAARMLLSGSMPSADGLMNSSFLARTLLPCSSSMATISASAPFPTVTLDLTQNPNPLQQFQRPPNQFQIPFPNASQNFAGALLPQIFGQALYNQSKFSGLQMSQDSDQSGQILSQLPMLQQNNGHNNNPLADTVNALTADPNFTAALAAAITSLIGNSNGNAQNNGVPNVNATNSNNNGSVTTSNSNGNNKVLNSGFQGN